MNTKQSGPSTAAPWPAATLCVCGLAALLLHPPPALAGVQIGNDGTSKELDIQWNLRQPVPTVPPNTGNSAQRANLNANARPGEAAGAAAAAAAASASSLPASQSAANPTRGASPEINQTIDDQVFTGDAWHHLIAPLKLKINSGLDGLSEEVIPALANPPSYFFPDTFLLNNESVSCFLIDVGIENTSLTAPVTQDSLHGYFGNDGKVFMDIDLDATASTTFFWELGVNPQDSGLGCDIVKTVDNIFDEVVNLLGGNTPGSQTPNDISAESLTVTASGLTAEADVTLGLAGDVIQVLSIDKLEAEIGEIDYSGTALIENAAALVETVADLFLGDVVGFINDQLQEFVLDSQAPRIQEMINTALLQNLTVEQSIALTGFQADVVVTPVALTSSRQENSMSLELTFDVTSSVAPSACATNLSYQNSPFGDAPETSSDFELQIPHWALAKIFYEAGRQGVFCKSLIMPLSTTPWDLTPNGALSVRNGRSVSEELTPSGFPVSVVRHQGEHLLTVPVLFQGDARGAFGSASADLEVYFELIIPERERMIRLQVTEIALNNVTGVLTTPKGAAMDMSAIVDEVLDHAAVSLVARMQALPLFPKTTAFAENLGLAVDIISINDSHGTVGISIVPLPAEDDGGAWQLEPYIETTPRFPTDVPVFEAEIRDRINPRP